MARQLETKYKVTGTLVALSPIHVGGLDAAADVDLTLAVNGQGQYYIPGTSLAGALRGWLQHETPAIKHLWGFQERDKATRGNRGHASHVIVEDAPISHGIAEVRDGVGLDRYTGSAAETIKFNRAVLPKGTRIPLELTFEQTKAMPAARVLFADTLHGLQQGIIRLGAAKTRGLGKVQLTDLKLVEQDLTSFDGMLATLSGQGTEITLTDLVPEDHQYHLPQQLEIMLHWQPVGPVMVKAEADGIAVDLLPLVSTLADESDSALSFVLPGSSIKGALRTQAERIIRTLLGQETNLDQPFLKQLTGVPLVSELFGEGAKYQGAMGIDDCYAKLTITPQQWIDIATAKDEKALQIALEAADLANLQQAFHVGIDRWTGGAAENYLYSTLELMNVTWEPICLRVDLSRLVANAEENAEEAMALLLLVLRDMAQARIPLGYGTNRGMGAIQVQSIVCRGEALADAWSALGAMTLIDDSQSDQPRALPESDFLRRLNQRWQQWINDTRRAA